MLKILINKGHSFLIKYYLPIFNCLFNVINCLFNIINPLFIFINDKIKTNKYTKLYYPYLVNKCNYFTFNIFYYWTKLEHTYLTDNINNSEIDNNKYLIYKIYKIKYSDHKYIIDNIYNFNGIEKLTLKKDILYNDNKDDDPTNIWITKFKYNNTIGFLHCNIYSLEYFKNMNILGKIHYIQGKINYNDTNTNSRDITKLLKSYTIVQNNNDINISSIIDYNDTFIFSDNVSYIELIDNDINILKKYKNDILKF